MKKNNVLFFLLLCLPILMKVTPAFCEKESLTWNKKLSSADSDYFTRIFYKQDFNQHQGYVNEILDETVFHQTFIYDADATDYASTNPHATDYSATDLLMSMLPAKQSYRSTNKYLNFLQYKKEEFHITFYSWEKENMPKNTGGRCWIRYSDAFSVGKGHESGVIFYPGDKAYRFDIADGVEKYTEIADLSVISPQKWTRFDFIRLDGTVYVYANKNYLFDFQDDIQGGGSFEMGSELRENGTRIRCDFDDFVMRIR